MRRLACTSLLVSCLAPVALLAQTMGAETMEAIRPDEKASVATLPPVGDHQVWVPDRLLAHSLLFDGDSGDMLGAIDGGTSLTPKPPLFAPDRGEFYSVEIDYARGRRGKRVDYVTIYDARTLDVRGEVVLPTHTSESNASVAYTALLDGGRFLATFNQFPTVSVSISDLEARRFVGEIPTTGCAGIYPTGERSFGMLCGDGTVLSVRLDARGRLLDMTPSAPFFDVVADPVMMAGARLDSRWLWVSFAGMAHQADFAQRTPTVESWRLSDEPGWRPGGLQHVALHRASRRLYVIFHEGGPGTHKEPGPEVWVFDLETRERIDRFAMPNFTAAFLGQQMGLPYGGLGSWLLHRVVGDGGAHAIAVTQDDAPLLFARNAEVGVVAVLDARTGAHLRNLDEAGLFGPTLQVAR